MGGCSGELPGRPTITADLNEPRASAPMPDGPLGRVTESLTPYLGAWRQSREPRLRLNYR
jgi:hypothetical protein